MALHSPGFDRGRGQAGPQRQGNLIPVRDGSPPLPRTVAAELEAEGGRGLWRMQPALAWGPPQPDSGKVVWCALIL
jgi:hypothetical protein